MAKFTLDDIRAAADKKYGAVEIDLGEDKGVVKLTNVLRLSADKRAELKAAQEALKAAQEADDGGDEVESMVPPLKAALAAVAENKTSANKLLKEVGDDLAVLISVFETYSGGTDLPEA